MELPLAVRSRRQPFPAPESFAAPVSLQGELIAQREAADKNQSGLIGRRSFNHVQRSARSRKRCFKSGQIQSNWLRAIPAKGVGGRPAVMSVTS